MSRLLQAALLGVLQGLTEFLPISSTAHLLIGSHLLGFSDPGGAFTVIVTSALPERIESLAVKRRTYAPG